MMFENPKPDIRRWFMGLALFMLPMFLLSCDSGSASLSAAGDTCQLSFNIDWRRPEQNSEANPDTVKRNELALADCTDIVFVIADVYSTAGILLKSGGPWQCSTGTGTIQDVPAGFPGYVVVYGLDADNNIRYRGQSGVINLIPSQDVHTGTIGADSYIPVLSAPADGATVSSPQWRFEWQALTSAADYRILVSTHQDGSDPLIDVFTNGNAVYSPAGLGDGQYFWRVFAVDENGRQSAGSDIWRVTLAIQDNTAPAASIESPNNNAVYAYGDTVVLKGSGSDAEDGALPGSSLTWSSDLDGTLGTGAVLENSTFSMGTHTITLTATDSSGAKGTAAVTVTISDSAGLDISGSWQFSITDTWASGSMGCAAGPSSEGTCRIIQTGNTFTVEFLSGVTCDPAFTCTYSGTVSGNRYVGSNSGVVDSEGGVVTNTIDFTAESGSLLVGQTTSQYILADYQCNWGGTLRMVPATTSGQPPTAAISRPEDNSLYQHGQSISFSGSATDPEDGDLTGSSLTWTSSIDGLIQTGATFTYSALSVGAHQITLTATDSQGNTDSRTINLTINSPPSVIINRPSNGSRYNSDAVVDFDGVVTDSEDGEILGEALTWASDVDGVIGSGNTLSTSELTYGKHVITLTATDSDGATGTDSINLTINSLPLVSIYQPANNSQFTPGAYVILDCTASDPEDGSLQDTAFVWTSSIDGQVATGSYTGTSSLSYGAHTVTCTVTDSLGGKASDSVSVVINTPPAVTIISPGPGDFTMPGDTISCQGSWSDAEDASLPAASIIWTYQEYANGLPAGTETTIGTGVNQTISFSDFADYRIRFKVTDSMGQTTTAAVDIYIGG